MNWVSLFDERQQQEIKFNCLYAERFGHGTDGHNVRLLVARMVEVLDALDTGRSIAGVPYADSWGLPVTGEPELWYLAQGHHSGHTGNDWNLKTGGDSDLGQPVVSVANGVTVHAAPGLGKWGNLVIVLCVEPDGVLTYWRYAHLHEMAVQEGQVVGKGEQLGTIGKGAGDAYAAHLHLDVRVGGLFHPSEWLRNFNLWLDPLAFLLKRGVAEIHRIEKRY